MKIHTIGFTKKSAEKFFGLLRASGATTLVDIRLNNVSQLAGFAKRDDLRYFLGELCGMSYTHRPDLAPTQPMLDDYKKQRTGWAMYENRFLELMEQRRIEDAVPREQFGNAVLLCSEDKPHHCHRRLVAEYLAQHWDNVAIEHLT
ncbi:uncharacterized protein DUF488 [Saccharopolyspora erythraea NRRL 2338]|uniref:DUF488 domain-containing protein n=1 Tax=Saccharopolyspora erythraea TaxID=1836 RepID=A0ABN1CXU4_SACER|nr:DUF488 domain-containing protein [Saccharopolyspora erythraea]EQD86128.1 hypothetical protein N599_11300 [Saccharopolyspora erythraea D]PFG94010.1 uncharacterized protein DUF488 [Saccharopolyspora erythraea NRRL 2338]QRK90818.1 DUF488 domain-containing protein [Saccharopolyspora erythraea]